jgi:hypothetical protein
MVGPAMCYVVLVLWCVHFACRRRMQVPCRGLQNGGHVVHIRQKLVAATWTVLRVYLLLSL